MHGDTRDLIQGYLYWFGVWEPSITAWLRGRLGRGDVFVDVGANVGYYTLLASRLVGPEGACVAIEASPSIYELLLRNLRLNRAANVRALNLAAAREPGRVALYEGGEHNIGKTSIVSSAGSTRLPAAIVEGQPLDRILTPEEIRRARLIKIDVEGAEAMVMDGLLPCLERTRQDLELIVELCNDASATAAQDAERIFSRLGAVGFHPYAVDNEYRLDRYLRPGAKSPRRMRAPPEGQVDVIFSRVDAEIL